MQQSNGPWVERFHRNPALETDSGARVLAVDRGRMVDCDEPPLLKSRSQLTLNQAREHWKARVKAGWKRVEPQW